MQKTSLRVLLWHTTIFFIPSQSFLCPFQQAVPLHSSHYVEHSQGQWPRLQLLKRAETQKCSGLCCVGFLVCDLSEILGIVAVLRSNETRPLFQNNK